MLLKETLKFSNWKNVTDILSLLSGCMHKYFSIWKKLFRSQLQNALENFVMLSSITGWPNEIFEWTAFSLHVNIAHN